MDELSALAKSAQAGDLPAFATFVRLTQGEMFRFVTKLTDSQRAEDITQEVYLRVWKALPSFSGTSSARTWLYGVAHNVVADHIRLVSRRRRLLERAGLRPTSLESVEHELFAPAEFAGSALQQTVGPFDEFLMALPPDQRMAFVLTQVLGFSYAETAELAKVAVGTIRSRVSRSREALIAMMKQAEAV
jgi:RNA polymerase sigma-70 factor, ECF subfamily